MDAADQERFLANYRWFNQFFEDLRLLFEKVGKALSSRYDLEQPDYYYRKPDKLPRIPQFYVMGVGGQQFAVQMFAVFDPSILENQRLFVPEPSIVFVVHGDGSKALYINDYGMRVIRNDRITAEAAADQAFVGKTRSEREWRFSAFQLPFDQFSAGHLLDETLQALVYPRIDAFRAQLSGG